MKRHRWRVSTLVGALILQAGGCAPTAASTTSAIEQLQMFLGDFLRSALAAYLT